MRDTQGRFAAGNKGRPPGALNRGTKAIREAAREYGPAMIDLLADVAQDPEAEPAVRLKAAGMLLDRAYGRPRPADEDPLTPAEEREKALAEKARTEAALEARFGSIPGITC